MTILKKIKISLFSAEKTDCKGFYENTGSKMVRLFVMLSLVLGTLIIFLSPPMSCPDENCHYLNICRISQGNLFAEVQDGMIGSTVTLPQAEFVSGNIGKYDSLSGEKYHFSDMYFQSYLTFSDESYFYPTALATINPVAYLFPSAGVGLYDLITGNTSPYNDLLVAKLCNLLVYVIITAYALKTTALLRNTMFLLALMPMTVYQAASTSYDSILIACCFSLFAVFSRILAEEDYTVGGRDIAAVCFSCFFIFGTKIAYAPLVLVFLCLGIKKFGNIRKYLLCIGAICLTGIVSYLIPTLIVNGITSGAAVKDALVIEQEAYVAENPGIIPGMLVNTVKRELLFWTQSFFGVLGNLNTNFPQPFLFGFLFILTVTALWEASVSGGFNIRLHILPVIAVIIIVVGSIMAMYLTWTPRVLQETGGSYATGMQGRYFIPVAIYGAAALCNPLFQKFRFSGKCMEAGTYICRLTAVLYSVLTAVLLLVRFWF